MSTLGRVGVAASLTLALLWGCVPIPRVDPVVDQPAPPDHAVAIEGSSGPLGPKQAHQVLDQLHREAGDSAVLERHLALQPAFRDSPLVAGNAITLLRDGRATMPAIFAAIRGAKKHIHLEYFTFEDIDDNGEHLTDLLIAKRRQGVAIAIIYDAIGSIDTPAAVFTKLRDAGIPVLSFNPLSGPTKSPNDRDHRKILVADGRVAFVGGVNLSAVYFNPRFSGSPHHAPPPDPTQDYWRDTDIRIEGPAVAQLQRVFLTTWGQQGGKPLADIDFYPRVPAAGTEVVRIIASTPDRKIPDFYVSIVSAMRNAESNIWLTAAYFVPTPEEREDLEAAARRGVDVRLLLPSRSDSSLAMNAQHSFYTELLKAGVKIYERRGVILHSKTVTIDGVWTDIGSSNFDQRSVVFNNEVDAVVLGPDTAGAFEDMFRKDLDHADQVDPAKWADRPFGERIKEFVSPIWEELL